MADAALKSKRYQVLTGLNYPGPKGIEVRKEPGDELDGKELTKAAIAWALERGHLAELKEEE